MTATRRTLVATATTSLVTDQDRTHVFDRVLVGIDASEASGEAARQAAVLAEHHGNLKLVGVFPPPRRLGLDPEDEFDPDDTRATIEGAVAATSDAISSVATPVATVRCGYAWKALIEEAERETGTLIVVGSHGQKRLEGILTGSTATELVHKAPCSVLVARRASTRFPERVVVGLDGSSPSARAYAAARRVAARFGSVLRPVVALGGEPVDLPAIEALTDGRYEKLQGKPVGALVAASADADLLVVGSRFLHGMRALGSVSERVAHRARCSTLVIREPAPPDRIPPG
jgi:nucleotide-binding universal stress UspA family protein